MAQSTIPSLQLYRDSESNSERPSALDQSSSTHLREQLLSEICRLDQRRSELELVDGKVDFSMQQTCKEMIHSRQVLFRSLRR